VAIITAHSLGDAVELPEMLSYLSVTASAGASEYEYWFAVEPDDLRRALDSQDNLTAAVKARAEEIIGTGEGRWLQDHGVKYDFHNRIEWE
jgi:hypothetical protein